MDSSEKYDNEVALLFAEVLRRLKQREELIDQEYETYEIVPKYKLDSNVIAEYRKVEK